MTIGAKRQGLSEARQIAALRLGGADTQRRQRLHKLPM